MRSWVVLGVVIGVMFVNFVGQCHGGGGWGLQVGFYKGKCKKNVDIERIVFGVIFSRFRKDPTITPALLRMHFHDCFVRGCDASILLDGSDSEKIAGPNLSVRGFDIIDEVKSAVEKACPGVVSCADIIAIATRDAISLAGGKRYPVQTGRRDGLISRAEDVDIPSPAFTVSEAISAFAAKNLHVSDMVLLLGGHTIGVTHCSNFQYRLYNFQNGKPDRTMNPILANQLRKICPQSATTDNVVDLDQNPLSANVVDNSFYRQIKMGRGVLQIDQELTWDPRTKKIVDWILRPVFDFQTQFGQAMVKLGSVGVLTGTQGEIRKSCRAINNPSAIQASILALLNQNQH
ncbi:hem peroxidase [Dillenia turbinata]|uniref:Peroxidase n=1 Tax=Dillenia turbinata TaxID=194707 RepID=A0AAN8VFK9_9MAGN